VTARQRGRSVIPGSSLRNQVAHDRSSLSTLRCQPGQETESCWSPCRATQANEDEFAAMVCCEPCSSSSAYSFQQFAFPSIKAFSHQRTLHSPSMQAERSRVRFRPEAGIPCCMLDERRLELQWAPERHHNFFAISRRLT
jgi:hypothetical protein